MNIIRFSFWLTDPQKHKLKRASGLSMHLSQKKNREERMFPVFTNRSFSFSTLFFFCCFYRTLNTRVPLKIGWSQCGEYWNRKKMFYLKKKSHSRVSIKKLLFFNDLEMILLEDASVQSHHDDLRW